MEIARTLSNLLINFWASRGDSNMAAINAFFEKTTSITLLTNCVSVERDPSNRNNEPSVVDGLAAQRKTSLYPRHTYNSIVHSLGKNGDINRLSLAIFRCAGCGLGDGMKRVIGSTGSRTDKYKATGARIEQVSGSYGCSSVGEKSTKGQFLPVGRARTSTDRASCQSSNSKGFRLNEHTTTMLERGAWTSG